MSAGTITLTNGSAIVGGSGTAFATEIATGDFIVSTVGGVPYTLPVKSVESNTQLTLVSNFTGPTQAGAAWSAVPRVALNMVTTALVAQSAEALRGLNYDKQNWQQVFSAAGNITVKLPDGTTFTGPSWKYVISQTSTLNGKTGGTVSGSVIATSGSEVGVATGSGGNKSISLSNVNSDGPAENYVNWMAGNYYSGAWRIGAIRGSGTDLARVQMNVYDGVSSNADFRWYPYGAFQSKTHIGPGESYGGGYQDVVNGYSTNTSFSRPNITTPNDGGFVPFGRWHTYCSGGYHAVTALGSISQGKSNWPSIELVTIGDSGSAGTRIFSFNTVTADISVSGSGGFGGNYIFSKQPNCDIELKHSVKYDDGYQSYKNIKQFRPATYVYNDDPRERVRRGVIAQDVMKIDSEYVTLVPAAPTFDSKGNRVDADDTLALDSNVIMLDTVLALNYVIKQLETTQQELQELKLKSGIMKS